MATESVDNRIAELLGLDHYSERFPEGAPAAKSWYLRVPLYDNDFEDVVGYQYQNMDKEVAALQAYYTRECARKVLEGQLAEAESLARIYDGEVKASVMLDLKNRIAELRAAIEEVGDGE